MDPSMEDHPRGAVTVYVDTNLDTRFVFQAERNKTFGELRGLLKCHHKFFYPDLGEVGLQNMMVELNSILYVIVESTLVGTIFVGKKGFLKVDMSCQAFGGISSLAEGQDALPADSQLLYDKVELPELASNACGNSAMAIEGSTTNSHPSEEVVALPNTPLELEVDEGDSPNMHASNSHIENVEVGLAKRRKKKKKALACRKRVQKQVNLGCTCSLGNSSNSHAMRVGNKKRRKIVVTSGRSSDVV